MLRVINKQIIFEDDEDRLRFLETLEYYKGICKFELYNEPVPVSHPCPKNNICNKFIIFLANLLYFITNNDIIQ